MTNPNTSNEGKDVLPITPEIERIKRENFYAAATFIEKTADLTEALRTDRMPDTSEYNFMFSGQKISTMYRPELIDTMIDTYGPLDEVTINTRYQEGDPSSSLSLHFYFARPDMRSSVLLTVERPGYYSENTTPLDIVYEDPAEETGVTRPVSPVPRTELSRLVASLIYPSRLGDWSVFDQLNLNDGTIHEMLVDALQKHADHYSGNEFYELTPLDQSRAGRLIYSVDDGELINAELHRVISSDIILHDGMPAVVEYTVAAEIDLLDGVSISFYDVHESDDITLNRQRISDVELTHYKTATEFAEHHTKRANPVQTERIVELNLPPYEQFPDDL